MFSLSLWILPLGLSSGNPVEDVPYPDILKEKERSRKWDNTINDTGYPGDLWFPTCWPNSQPEPAKHQLLHLPAQPLAWTVGPQGTYTDFKNAYIVAEIQVVY